MRVGRAGIYPWCCSVIYTTEYMLTFTLFFVPVSPALFWRPNGGAADSTRSAFFRDGTKDKRSIPDNPHPVHIPLTSTRPNPFATLVQIGDQIVFVG